MKGYLEVEDNLNCFMLSYDRVMGLYNQLDIIEFKAFVTNHDSKQLAL